VRVPPGDGPWPVLWAHDGQNLFDPNGPFGSWALDAAVGGLDTPILVVGVDNTLYRFGDYTHTTDVIDGQTLGGNADAYAAFLVDVARPLMAEAYGASDLHGALGSSLGGLVSLHVATTDPAQWDFVASLSGTLGWGRFGASNETMQDRWLTATPDVVVYVDSGGDNGGDGCTDPDDDGFFEDDPNDADNFCTNRAFADALAANGYVWDETLYHWHESGAPHNEAAWGARVHRPLEIFAGLAR
jgi:predicted alpha/beta superfamily hydrolase